MSTITNAGTNYTFNFGAIDFKTGMTLTHFYKLVSGSPVNQLASPTPSHVIYSVRDLIDFFVASGFSTTMIEIEKGIFQGNSAWLLDPAADNVIRFTWKAVAYKMDCIGTIAEAN